MSETQTHTYRGHTYRIGLGHHRRVRRFTVYVDGKPLVTRADHVRRFESWLAASKAANVEIDRLCAEVRQHVEQELYVIDGRHREAAIEALKGCTCSGAETGCKHAEWCPQYADVRIEKDVHGPATVYAFVIENPDVLGWLEENVQGETSWLGKKTLVVEHRYADLLADGLREAGYNVK